MRTRYVDRGEELCTLLGHTAEIVSLNFNSEGDKIITGSFDHTTKVVSMRCISLTSRRLPALACGVPPVRGMRLGESVGENL